MAFFTLASLSARARLAYPLIRSAVRRGLSANTIQTKLMAAGMGLRRQTVQQLVRTERFIVDLSRNLDRLNPANPVPPSMLPPAITKLTRNLSYTMEVRGYLVDTGESTSQFVTLSMDQTMSPQEMADLAADIVEGEPKRYGMIVEDVRLVEGLRAGELGTL